MIRDAKAVDIPAIVAFLRECHARSHYAGGPVRVDEQYTKELLVQAIFRHGHVGEGGTWGQVAEHDGKVCGLILGTLQRVYCIGDKLFASDLFWIVNDEAKPGDAMALLRGMIKWARRAPLCVEVRCGATAVVKGPQRAGRMLEAAGMKHYGQIYRLDIDRADRRAA